MSEDFDVSVAKLIFGGLAFAASFASGSMLALPRVFSPSTLDEFFRGKKSLSNRGLIEGEKRLIRLFLLKYSIGISIISSIALYFLMGWLGAKLGSEGRFLPFFLRSKQDILILSVIYLYVMVSVFLLYYQEGRKSGGRLEYIVADLFYPVPKASARYDIKQALNYTGSLFGLIGFSAALALLFINSVS